MKRRVGIYLRVSTDGQTTENQRRELEAVAARSGWEVVGIYEDAGVSGSNGREKRPGLDRLLKDATARRINMIAAWSVDRLGRSLQHLVELLNEPFTAIYTCISKQSIRLLRQARPCSRCVAFLQSLSAP
jgi:DNA invertase Pin-like site-specific DNA recombinase